MLEIKREEWSYITLPNKMYQLVKNTGDMNKIRVGYFTDAESEMLTILDYLNYGEKTNITESMIDQVDKVIREAAEEVINSDDEMSDGEESDDKLSGLKLTDTI